MWQCSQCKAFSYEEGIKNNCVTCKLAKEQEEWDEKILFELLAGAEGDSINTKKD